MTTQFQTPVADQVYSETGATAKRVSILDTAVLIRLEFGRFGVTRKVSKDKIELTEGRDTSQADSAKDLLSTNKRILKCKEYDAIQSFDATVTKYIRQKGLASGIMDGLYFVPLAILREVNTHLKRQQDLRADLVENLCEVYTDIWRRDREELQPVGLYDPNDYPTVDVLRDSFKFQFKYVEMVAPKSLETIDRDLYMDAKAKLELGISEATESIRELLRQEFAEIVAHMAERLEPTPDGKKKIFKNSLLGNWDEFLTTFQNRNLTNDADLAALVAETQRLTRGVTPDRLRDRDGLRSDVQRGVSEIKSKLDGLLTDAKSRAIVM